MIGPLAAGALAVGVGLTQSWHMALFAGLIVLAVRQFEDYIVVPRVLGHAIGLSPLVVLFSVTAIGILLGGFYVLLAIPIAAVLATLVDVVLRDVDPAEQDVPAVLFAGREGRSRLARLRAGYALRQRPKTRPPRVKPRPKVPTREAADRDRLAPGGEALPAPERLLLLGRQRLAAALLAQRAAGAQAEVEVVEDLGGVVGHGLNL